MWLLAGPIKCNWPSVTLWSVFQYPVTYMYKCMVNAYNYSKQILLVTVRMMSPMLELLLGALLLGLSYLLFCALLLCCFCTSKEENVLTMLNILKVCGYIAIIHTVLYVAIAICLHTEAVCVINICHNFRFKNF